MHKETKKFPNKELGEKGEALAKQFLLQKGFNILESNFKYSYAEIDLIAMDGDILVFIEVKTRSSVTYGEPEEFVDRKKESLLFEPAMVYMDIIDHTWEIRFDIIAIVKQGPSYRIKHLKDAFCPGMA